MLISLQIKKQKDFSSFCLLKLQLNYNYSPKLSTQVTTSSSEAPDRNLIPSSHSPVPASSASNSPLSPKPELADVQNGITVFPVKSFASIKVFTGHAAIPHHTGYPTKTFSYSSNPSTVAATSSTFLRLSSAYS